MEHKFFLFLFSITEFIGHLHPVVVHLPIGILLLACLFLWQSRKDKYENLQSAIDITLLLGMLSAWIACITGYLLSTSGDYNASMVSSHQWLGISVAVISTATYFFRRSAILRKWQWLPATMLLPLITITGHLGGSLTHGSDYLTAPLKNTDSATTKKFHKPITDLAAAKLYGDIIEPIFESKCYSCHGYEKQKGKLRMDDSSLIMKGGKDGLILVPGSASQSAMIKRILLAENEEHHMPPKEKPQLTPEEITLVSWWINKGADFHASVSAYGMDDTVKQALKKIVADSSAHNTAALSPEIPVEKASSSDIKALESAGAIVTPIARGSNYLSVDFINNPAANDSTMKLLPPLRKQMLWLRLSHTSITDSGMAFIAECKALIKLQLYNVSITDKGLAYLKNMPLLEELNLVGTRVTEQGLMQISSLPKLKNIYLYKTSVSHDRWPKLEQAFPHTRLDSGGYTVPQLPTDTVVVKPKTKP